ncbi:hypothetical protein BDV93DRAFT_516657 [Ceratobasidium sp. AG-I]|nr:hypothetical protein BDV93DRAFT_516657 [Ceratobasidium sp. AG-I]
MYLQDLANMHIQLSAITFPSIGAPVEQSEGIYCVGPDVELRKDPFHAPGDTEEERLKRQFVAKIWRDSIRQLLDASDSRGPFPLCHGDLHHENTLVDSAGHIVGVLDWDCATVVPWGVFAVLTFEVTYRFADEGRIVHGAEAAPRSAHFIFNQALREAVRLPDTHRLAQLPNSKIGQVAGCLAYFLPSMDCDYDNIGRSLYELMNEGENLDSAFNTFAVGRRTWK